MNILRNISSTIVAVCILSSALYSAQDISKWIRPKEVPQPNDNKLTPKKIELGKLLFFDVRLSSSNKISCATCHHPKRGWTDLIEVSKAVGDNGAVGPRNSPVLLNSAYQHNQFWDGRVKTLEDQALGPIQNPVEMNISVDKLIQKLNNIKGYVKLFKEAYPNEGITKDSIAKAIASFERTIVSTTSPFDRYIQGDKTVLSNEAQEGYKLFMGKAHCVYCHDGFNFTDGSFHNIGLKDGELKGSDLGRYVLKHRTAWYGAMKTPTLRDITKSAPYFHDGSVKTLEEAVAICGNGGRFTHNVKNKSTFMVDRKLTRDDIKKIVSFLESLTGPDLELEIPNKFPQ